MFHTYKKTNILNEIWVPHGGTMGCDVCWFVDTSIYQYFRGLQESISVYQTTLCHIPEDVYHKCILQK